MPDEPASLLTDAQRRRLSGESPDGEGSDEGSDDEESPDEGSDDEESPDEGSDDEESPDEGSDDGDFPEDGEAELERIRERVAAGLADFEHLAAFPDDQFERALEDVDDGELTRTLAEVRVVEERIRLLRGIEADAVVEAARDVAAGVDAGEEGGTVDRVEFHTAAERRELAEREAEGASEWLSRAEALLQVGLVFVLASVVIALVAPGAASGPVGGAPFLIGSLALVAGLAIVAYRGVKHDLVPALGATLDDLLGRDR